MEQQLKQLILLWSHEAATIKEAAEILGNNGPLKKQLILIATGKEECKKQLQFVMKSQGAQLREAKPTTRR